MSESDRITALETTLKVLSKTITKHDTRCNELDAFKKKWVVSMIILGIVFGSIGTILFNSKEWIWDAIPVPKHYHQHHHDKNGDMILSEGLWGQHD